MGLNIREIDDSLRVVKRDPSLPAAIQLNASSGPVLVAAGVEVGVGVVVTGGEDDSVLFDSNDDARVPIPPGAAHIM